MERVEHGRGGQAKGRDGEGKGRAGQAYAIKQPLLRVLPRTAKTTTTTTTLSVQPFTSLSYDCHVVTSLPSEFGDFCGGSAHEAEAPRPPVKESVCGAEVAVEGRKELAIRKLFLEDTHLSCDRVN